MSRHGYVDDLEDYPNQLELYRQRVRNAITGKRGQRFFRELAGALDAMPVKSLCTKALKTPGGEFCTLGVAMHARGIDVPVSEPEDDEGEPDWDAKQLNIAECLAAETAYENDEGGLRAESGEQRWQRMRAWVAKNIRQAPE